MIERRDDRANAEEEPTPGNDSTPRHARGLRRWSISTASARTSCPVSSDRAIGHAGRERPGSPYVRIPPDVASPRRSATACDIMAVRIEQPIGGTTP